MVKSQTGLETLTYRKGGGKVGSVKPLLRVTFFPFGSSEGPSSPSDHRFITRADATLRV